MIIVVQLIGFWFLEKWLYARSLQIKQPKDDHPNKDTYHELRLSITLHQCSQATPRQSKASYADEDLK